MKSLFRTTCCALLLLAGCSTAPKPAPPSQPAPGRADLIVPESWISAPSEGDELESLTVWPGESGSPWVIASAKSSQRLVVFDGDSGQRLRAFGEPGKRPGQFNRPNGLAVFGNLLFVAERDNHRLQVLELPSFKPLLVFGEDVLRTPYGLWLHETGPGTLEVLVTDNYMVRASKGKLSGDKENDWIPPPLAELGERIKRFEVTQDDDGKLAARYLGAFGATSEAGALRTVESIAGDVAAGRLLIAEEYPRIQRTLREYSMDGRYLDHDLPGFSNDPEGVALWACDAERKGYWVTVDQQDPTIFRLFARQSLAPAGSFSGATTANTDGISLYPAGSRAFPGGVLYAVHKDRSVAAFDLADVARSLTLDKACQ